jgi:D-alanyl-D-alanine carboxypeptidase/D-alanyl-D-alanine-endopeptidase (penicillin-binding protein 4)
MVALPATSDYSRLPRVGVFRSPPFRDVITVTLKVSHNLYASTLPCLVAAAKGHTTAEAGLREQQKVLRELGVDVGQVSFSGGAGGGAADHVTPRATVQLLQGMAKRPEWGAFKAAMPSLGIDGTLYDAVGENSQAKGKVFAKTGTLVWYDAVNDRILLKSKALAGTMTTRNGKELLFAFIVNNVPLPAGVTSAREGKVLAKLCEILYAHGP